MINNIVTKDEKQKIVKYMMDELERAADIKEYEFKMYDRMMREKSEIQVDKCKGRD